MWNTDYLKELKDWQAVWNRAVMQAEALQSLLKTYSKMDWMSPSKKPKKDD
jgi:hypothetical protein